MVEISSEALVNFVSNDVLQERPQVVDGNLRYIFCGSLGTMLYDVADTMRRGDGDQLPAINVGEPTPIDKVHTFLRQISDMDIARTKAGSNTKALMKSRIEDSTGVITRRGFTYVDPANVFTCPYVELVLSTPEGPKPVYVASPEEIVGHKVAHFMTFADNSGADHKTFSDLESLVTGMVSAIPDFNHAEVRRIGFNSYDGWMPLPYQRSEFSGPVRQFIEDLIQSHPDAAYLQDREFAPHLDLSVLLAIERFDGGQSKRAILEFFNSKKDDIIQFEPHPRDPRNIEVASQYFLDKGLENEPRIAREVERFRNLKYEEDRGAPLPVVVKKIVQQNPWLFYQSSDEWTAFNKRSDIEFPTQRVARVPYFRAFRHIEESDVPYAINLFKLAGNGRASDVARLLEHGSKVGREARHELFDQAAQAMRHNKPIDDFVYQARQLSR